MRPIRSLLAILACAAPLAAVESSIAAAKAVRSAAMAEVVARPDAFLTTQVRFRAVVCGLVDIYDRDQSWFRPEQYYNIAVWDEHAALWEKPVRGEPLVTLYINRDRLTEAEYAQLSKYRLVEIEARVREVLDGKPVLDVLSLVPVLGADRRPLASVFTDVAIARIEQGMALADEGAVDLAETHFAAAMAIDLPPIGVVGVGAMRARNLMAGGRFAEADAVLAQARSASAGDPGMPVAQQVEVLALAARCANEQAERGAGDRRAAATMARAALALDPGFGEAYAVLGVALAGLGQLDEARRQCDIAVRMRPNDAEVRWCLGRILDTQGHYDEAIEAIKKAIDLTPKDHRLHKSVAVAYLHQAAQGGADAPATLETALRECDIALRLQAGDGEAHFIAGQVIAAAAALGGDLPIAGKRQKATLDLAMQRYRQAIAAAPTLAPAYLAIADILEAGKRLDDIAALAEILAAAGGDAEVVASLRLRGTPPPPPVAAATGATTAATAAPAKPATTAAAAPVKPAASTAKPVAPAPVPPKK